MRIFWLPPFLLALFLAGCGFQLRGSNAGLSDRFQKTYIENTGSNDDAFYQQIKQRITLSGGRLVNKKNALISIHLSPISINSRQLAVSGDGSLKVYERTYQATIRVVDEKHNIQLGKRLIKTVKTTQTNNRQIIANEEQTRITNAQANADLSNAALLYLQSF